MTVLDPKVIRLAVAGNVLAMPEPRSVWAKNFLQLPVSLLDFLRLARD
jgi:hypothetical protein